MSTYYNTTLSAVQRSALANATGDTYMTINAGRVQVAVAPGTEAALASNLVTALQAAGNTVAG
jgi:hypothetical protein